MSIDNGVARGPRWTLTRHFQGALGLLQQHQTWITALSTWSVVSVAVQEMNEVIVFPEPSLGCQDWLRGFFFF